VIQGSSTLREVLIKNLLLVSVTSWKGLITAKSLIPIDHEQILLFLVWLLASILVFVFEGDFL